MGTGSNIPSSQLPSNIQHLMVLSSNPFHSTDMDQTVGSNNPSSNLPYNSNSDADDDAGHGNSTNDADGPAGSLMTGTQRAQDHLIPGVNIPACNSSSIHTDACNNYSPSRLSDARIMHESPTRKIELQSDYDDGEPAAVVNVPRNIMPSSSSSSAHPVVDLQGPSDAATAAGGQQQLQDSSDAVPAGAHLDDQEVEQQVAVQQQDQDGFSEVASSRLTRIVVKCDGMQPAIRMLSFPVSGADSALDESDVHSERGFVPDPDATESGSD